AAASVVGRWPLGGLGDRRGRPARRRGELHVERRPPRRLRHRARRRALVQGARVTAHDFVIIGAGASGEAAAHYARARGASVAIVDRDLFGGSCPFWACMPSKTLLHAAEVKAHGGDYPWPAASARRGYMSVREGREYPDDGGHVRSLEN